MTANQINYLRSREDYRHNQAQEVETKRYNKVQEELKRIDQNLQEQLNAINAKYKEKQYQLDRDLYELELRRTDRQLDQRDRELAIKEQGNAINWANINLSQDRLELDNRRQEETERANRISESQKQQYISMEQSQLPVRIESMHVSNAMNREKITTEQYHRNQVQSQTFRNYFDAGINAINSIVKAASGLAIFAR